jgi:hypothetical protein
LGKAIINLLKRDAEHNPNGEGLTAPAVWRQLKQGDNSVTLGIVEGGLKELIAESKVERILNGITYYRLLIPVDAPAEKAAV